jgi:gliding motility-associated-like protein
VLNPILNNTGNVTYYAQANDGICPSLSRTAVTLTINAAPIAPVSGGDITQCEIAPIQTLTATATVPLTQNIIWYDAPTAGNIVLNPILNATGNVTYYAQSNDGSCDSTTRTAVTLTINPAPTAPVSGGDITQCEIAPIQTLTATATVPLTQNIIWYDTPTAGNIVLNPILNNTGNVTYYAQANDGSCDSTTRTAVTLTINPAPTAPVSGGDITQCEIAPIQTLTATATVPLTQNIIWYDTPTAGNIVLNPILNNTGNVTYYAQANDGSCDSTTRTAVTLTINPAPTAPVSGGDITQCEIAPIQTLTATATVPLIQNITWYDAPTAGNIVLNPILNNSGTVTYYAQAVDGICPSLSRTAVTLTINPAPTAPVSGGDITQCEIAPIQTLTATAAVPLTQNITWYDAPTAGNIVLNPILNNTGNVTYYAQANNGSCDSTTRTAVTLTINPAPTAPVSGGDITQCEIAPIQTLTATATVPLTQNITWYDAPTAGNIVLNPILNNTGTVTYYAQAVDGICPSLSRTAVTLTINAAPIAPVSGGDITQCEIAPIQTLTATATVPLSQNITWYDAPTAGNIVLNPILNNTGTVTYYAQAVDGICPSLSRTAVTLTINPAPNAPVSGGDITQCEIAPIQTLTATATVPLTQNIIWYDAPTAGNIVLNPILNATGNVTYYAQSNDGSCDSTTRTAVTLTINPAPNAPISGGDITQCEIAPIQTLTATATVPLTQNIIWYDAPTAGNIVLNPILNNTGNVTYYAQAVDGICPSLSRTAVTLTIDAAPTAPVSGGDIFQCEQTPLQTITASATVQIGQNIVWYDAPTAGNIVPNPSINTAISVVYFAEANDGTCASLTRTPVILTINELPAIPSIGLLTQPDCFTSTGSITIFPVPAGVTYSFNGGPFDTTTFYGLLPAGTSHTITAQNTGGCFSPTINVVILPQPTVPSAPIVTIIQPTCTAPTGGITIASNPGETYSFNSGPFTNNLIYNNLLAGSTHNITAKSSDGCISTATSATLNIQPLIPAAPALTPVQPTCTVSTGSVEISNVLGETYSFDGSPYVGTLIYNGLTAGSTHTVTAQNGSGCISLPSTLTLDIQPPTPLLPNLFVAQPNCTDAFGEITILNNPGETYSFDGRPFTSDLIYDNLTAGIYTITATNIFNCISPVASVTIDPQPITITPQIIDGVICVDQVTGLPFRTHILDTGLNLATHSFVWTLDGLLFPQTGSSIEATLPGIYTVVATNIATGCDSPVATAIVTQSFPGLGISTQVINQFTNDVGIIVTVNTGTGPYLYQLDNSPVQQNNIFSPVLPGTHLVSVTDLNGCTNLSTSVTVIGYMNFFTPNNDNYNDTWNIIGLEQQSGTIIHIFDRYGKFIKQISANGPGWDGTINGQPLPSTDYWFSVEYNENGQSKEFKSHFSLVR